MPQISIPSGWLRGIQDSLSLVETSGQAYAAIWASKDFADDAASAVKAGGSWWSPDPWRTSAAQQLSEAGVQITREESPYQEKSSTAIDRGTWSGVAAKISNVYALARMLRDAFPPGEDSGDFDTSLIQGAAILAQSILDAPRAAVAYVKDIANEAVSDVGDVVKNAVKQAAAVAKEAATGAKNAAEAAIPWEALLVGGLVLAAAVGGLVLLARSGAIKQVGGLVHG